MRLEREKRKETEVSKKLQAVSFLFFLVVQMEIAVIGDEHFVLGFHIAGVNKGIVVERDTVNKAFENLINTEGIGIVAIEKKTFEMLSERNKEIAMTKVKPTVVTLSHDIGGESNLRLMIKRSLGVDLWKGD